MKIVNPFQAMMLAAIIMFSVSGCFDDEDYIDVTTVLPDPYEIVTSTLHGLVVDENDVPVAGARVTLFNEQHPHVLESDQNGRFLLVDGRIPRQTTIRVSSSEGSAQQGMSMVPNQVNFKKIKVYNYDFTGTINGERGGDIHYNGMLLRFPPNAVVDEFTKEPWTEDVRVDVRFISPNDPQFLDQFIGDFSGVDRNGNRQALVSAGMLTSRWLGGDITLQVADEKNVELFIPNTILDLQFGGTPLLWSYDEQLGIWIESENPVSRNVDGLWTNIPGGGTWNFDYKVDPIDISGKLVFNVSGNAQENLAGHHKIFLGNEDIGKRGGYSASNGEFVFNNFPKDEPFTLTVLDDCENTLFQSDFGPSDRNKKLPDIEIDLSHDPVQITGTVLDCNAQLLQAGLVEIKLHTGQTHYQIIQNGQISIQFETLCATDDPVQLSIIDRATLEQSFQHIIPLSDGDVDLSQIMICDVPEVYFQYHIEGEQFVDCHDPIIYLTSESYGCGDFLITTPGLNATGNYFDNLISIFLGARAFIHAATENFAVTITEFNDQPGGFIAGNISGTVREQISLDTYGPNKNITGKFRIKVN